MLVMETVPGAWNDHKHPESATLQDIVGSVLMWSWVAGQESFRKDRLKESLHHVTEILWWDISQALGRDLLAISFTSFWQALCFQLGLGRNVKVLSDVMQRILGIEFHSMFFGEHVWWLLVMDVWQWHNGNVIEQLDWKELPGSDKRWVMIQGRSDIACQRGETIMVVQI